MAAVAAARGAAAAISLAMKTNAFNRIPSEGYSPVYGYSAFMRGRPVRISMTFMPIPAYTNNAAAITGVAVQSSRFVDGYQWNTGDYDIRIVETDPVVSEIGWPLSDDTRAVIYYSPRKEEE